MDEATENGRRIFNKELYDMVELVPVTSFVMEQIIQWLDYIMNKEKIKQLGQQWNRNSKGEVL